MIRIFCIFLLLLISVWLGVVLQRDPGYVLIALRHWTLETTLAVASIALIACFLILHFFLLLLHRIMHLPRSIQAWRDKRRIQKAQAKTRQGLIEFSEGHWQAAQNNLIKALPDTDTPLLNYLTAARAAQEMGNNTLRDDYLRRAQQTVPEAKIAVELTQAQLQVANQQWEQALATLRHLHDLAPRHPYVLKQLIHLYEEVRDWPHLLALLPEVRRYNVLTAEAYEQLQKRTYLNTLLDLIKQDQPIIIDQFMRALPKNLMFDSDLNAEYCHYFIQKQRYSEAEALLQRCLRKHYHDKLILLYSEINTDPPEQLKFAETLLNKQTHSAPLFLCLGRLSKYQQLWGKAKNYLTQSIQFGATPRAYWELGQLYELQKETEQACLAYRDGLDLKLKD